MAISEKTEMERSTGVIYRRSVLTLKREVDRIYDKQKASRRENVAFIRRLNHGETTREEEQTLLRQIIDANQEPITGAECKYLLEISKAFMKDLDYKMDIGRRHESADMKSIPANDSVQMSDEEFEKWQERKPKMIS